MADDFDQFKGKNIVQEEVSRWSKDYINQVFFIESVGNIWW